MHAAYFQTIMRDTPTRLWINNPTGEEITHALTTGAVNITTNPAYCARLLRGEPEYLHAVIDRVVPEVSDNDEAADAVYQQTASRIMQQYLPVYETSHGRDGFVTVQADPRKDHDADYIIAASLRHRALGKNYMAKIPATHAGIKAMEHLLGLNMPVCATEIFSLAQALHVCEMYQRVAARNGNHPVFYVTHITGILDEYLQRVVQQDKIDISPEVLRQAGCAVARKEYRLLKERGYPVRVLGGGARGTHHFTEFVGGDMDITINWSTAREIMEADTPVVSRIDEDAPPEIIAELTDKIPDFRRAYLEDGLSVEEFAGFGPVRLFLNNFIEGYYRLLAEIPVRRAKLLAW